MSVLLKADHACNGPADGDNGPLEWKKAGDVVECHDEVLAEQLLRQPHIHEVAPDEKKAKA